MTQLSEFKVTLCPSISEPAKVYHRSLETVLNGFSSDQTIKKQVEAVRNAPDKQTYSELKNKLPIVVFAGLFTKRKNDCLTQSSGLMILDFDVETQYESDELKNKLQNDDFIFSYFKSTGGIGYRALIRIPVVQNDVEYKQYFNAIHERYPNIDIACKDIARACFYTYDPDLYVNVEAPVWEKKKHLKRNSVSGAKLPSNKQNDYNTANRVLNIIRYANVGERHNKILKASILMGGFVASGIMEYSEGERLLKNESEAIDPESWKINEQAVEDGLKEGLNHPVDTDNEDLKKEETEAKFGKIYYTVSDAEENIDQKFKEGIGQGWTVGYECIDHIYKIFPGYFTTLYGPSFTGKSLIWFDFLKNLSFRYGLKHCIFSPETGGYDDVFIKLIEMVAEKDFYDQYGNQMDSVDLEKAKRFVDEHFIVIDPGMETLDLENAINYLQIIESVYNVKVNTFTLDPWNDLDHPLHENNYREDKYLEKAIKQIRLAAYYNNWHLCIITHARDQKLSNAKTEDGKSITFYPPANFREIAGGQTWSRKGFQMASVWRPPRDVTEYQGIQLSGRADETVWIQQKYKPDWAGNSGYGILRLDPKKHRFYEGPPENPRYAKLWVDNDSEQTDTADADETAPF